jgi:MFS family permease
VPPEATPPSATPGPGPGAVAHVRLYWLLAMGLVVGTVNGLSRVSLPLFAAHLGGESWQVGAVGGLGYAGIMLLSLPLGAAMEHHGARRVYLFGVAAASAVYLLALPVVPAPGVAIGVAAVLGLLMPLRILPPQTEFLHLMPQLSPGQAGWSRASNMIGMFFLGPSLAAALIGALGFPDTFRIVGLLLSTALVMGWYGLEPAAQGAAAQRAATGVWAGVRSQLRLLGERAELRRAMALDLVSQMAVAYFVVFIVVLAVRQFGLPLPTAAALVTVQGVAYVAMLLGGARLLHGQDEVQRYRWGFALLLGFALCVGLARSPWQLWPGAVLLGLGLAIQNLTAMIRFSGLMQQYGRGRVGGVISVAPTAGGVVGTLAGGLVSQHLGTQAGFLVLAAAFAVALMRLWRRPQV